MTKSERAEALRPIVVDLRARQGLKIKEICALLKLSEAFVSDALQGVECPINHYAAATPARIATRKAREASVTGQKQIRAKRMFDGRQTDRHVAKILNLPLDLVATWRAEHEIRVSQRRVASMKHKLWAAGVPLDQRRVHLLRAQEGMRHAA